MEVPLNTDAENGASAVAATSAAGTADTNEFDEFDDNDDEFASFDMEAAISCAPTRVENAHPNMSNSQTVKTPTPVKRAGEYESLSSDKRLKPSGTDGSNNAQSNPDIPFNFQEITPEFQSCVETSLKRYFGHNSFREGQLEIIHSVLHNRDACAFWATGAGKSLTYQLPPLHLNQVGIVVTPLVSLMMDQVAQLNARNIAATYLGASQQDGSIEGRVFHGEFRLVYVTPEKLVSGAFLERLGKMHESGGRGRVCIFAVDERCVHIMLIYCTTCGRSNTVFCIVCVYIQQSLRVRMGKYFIGAFINCCQRISALISCICVKGHDFRPEFLKIGSAIRTQANLASVPILALTATAVPRVQDDIMKNLHMKSGNTTIVKKVRGLI